MKPTVLDWKRLESVDIDIHDILLVLVMGGGAIIELGGCFIAKSRGVLELRTVISGIGLDDEQEWLFPHQIKSMLIDDNSEDKFAVGLDSEEGEKWAVQLEWLEGIQLLLWVHVHEDLGDDAL